MYLEAFISFANEYNAHLIKYSDPITNTIRLWIIGLKRFTFLGC